MLVLSLGVIGPAEVCQARIQQFVAAGIQLPIVMPFTPATPVVTGYLQAIEALAALASWDTSGRGIAWYNAIL